MSSEHDCSEAIAQARAEERAPLGCGHATANLTDGVLNFPPSCGVCAALAELDRLVFAGNADCLDLRARLARCHETGTSTLAVSEDRLKRAQVAEEAREKAEARARVIEAHLNAQTDISAALLKSEKKLEVELAAVREALATASSAARAVRNVAPLVAVANCTHVTGPEAGIAACSACIGDALTPPAQEPHPEPCETCDATGSGIVPAQETEPES